MGHGGVCGVERPGTASSRRACGPRYSATRQGKTCRDGLCHPWQVCHNGYMNTAAGRTARTQSEADASRSARRHTHTQHRIRMDRMLVRADRREILQELAR